LAEKFARQGLEIGDTVSLWENMLVSLQLQGRHDEAEDALDKLERLKVRGECIGVLSSSDRSF